ncbi:MAG: Pyridoxamine 5-phosphate oxidase [Betaproteobacteria bacterium]|nr:Pyridoxamine 5-phosphate oxidase [Betaproteobacteria bacterium]
MSAALDVAQIRQDYRGERLDERDVAREPIAQFNAWFEEALRGELPMDNAMTIATDSADSRPAARMVLLKGVDQRGFVFFTDYESRKAQELAANPRAALLFFWIELEREVRIEGAIEKTSAAESDAYFASRPVASRLAAIASPQSAVIADRSMLDERYAQAEQRYGAAPPRPPNWGGYRVVPDAIEFWQGRPNRLHDRLLYTKNSAGGWDIVRLAP